MNSRINVFRTYASYGVISRCSSKFSKVICCIRGSCNLKRINISRVTLIIDCHTVPVENQDKLRISRLVVSFIGFIRLTRLACGFFMTNDITSPFKLVIPINEFGESHELEIEDTHGIIFLSTFLFS